MNELATVAPRIPARRHVTYVAVRAGQGRWRIPLAVAGGTAVLTSAVVVGLALVNPQVTALAAPSIAYPGTTAVVAYAAAGIGTFSYHVDAPSRRRSGTLAARQGTLELSIVDRDANSAVVIVVRAAGALGGDARVVRIRVLPRPHAAVLRIPSNAVHIDAFSVSAATVASGADIGVSYRSNATSGRVLLRDVRGGTWQSAPLSKTGFTRFRAPPAERDTAYNVVLQGRRNGAGIENSVALLVTATAPSKHTNADAAVLSAPAATRDIPAVVRSGALVVTSAGAGRPAAVIELTGEGGIALQRATPRADGKTELRMPLVTAPHSYLVSVSYRSGAGREASFHWVRVLPARR